MAEKKTPPGMMLFESQCNQLLSGEFYTPEEVGAIIIAAWSVFRGQTTMEEAQKQFPTRDMRIAFENVIQSGEVGKKLYNNSLNAKGLGGITNKLAKMPNWNLEKVHEKVDELRKKGYTEEDIVNELKIIQHNAADAKRAKEKITGLNGYGFGNGSPEVDQFGKPVASWNRIP